LTEQQRPCDHSGGRLLYWRWGRAGPGETQQQEQQGDRDEQRPHGDGRAHREPTLLGEDQQEQQQDERREHHPQRYLRPRGDRVIGEHEEKEQQAERDNQDSCRDTLGQRQH
jgi:hypothetical protein